MDGGAGDDTDGGTHSARAMLARRRSSMKARETSDSSDSPRAPIVHRPASMRSRNPRLEGYLYKKTKGIKGIRHFQKRWVVLYPDSCVIAYYRKRKDADKEFHVRNNMGVTVMPWAAAGIIPIDLITSVYPTRKNQRFDISVSRAAGKNRGKTYQWKCVDQRQRDLWVEAIALVHHELQRRQRPEIVDDIESGEDEVTDAAADDDADVSEMQGNFMESDDPLLPLRSVSSLLEPKNMDEVDTSAYGLSSRPSGKELRTHSRNRSNQSNTSAMSSSSARTLYALTSEMQASEVLGRLLTTDRFAPLRPPPTSSRLPNAPSMAESVGRSLVGADHMPNSGESAMEDSDSSDEYDTDETDPDDVRDYIRELQQEATSAANAAPVLVQRGRGHKGADTKTPIPVHTKSDTLIIDTERVDRDAQKRALLIDIEDSDTIEALMQPRDLEIKVGWLHKLGRINKSWKRRFCVITHGQLLYYTSQTRQELKGVMDLVNIKATSIDASVFHPPSNFCLAISHSISSRRLVIACDSAAEHEEWCRAIQHGSVESVKQLPPGMAAENINSSAKISQRDQGSAKRSGFSLLNLHLSDLNTKRVLENADWAGFMTKCGRVNKSWNTRLFVLKGSLLTYFEAEQKIIKILSRKGALSMAGAKVTRVVRDDGSMGIDIFTSELDGGVRHLMLKFPNGKASGLSKWIEKLEHAARRFAIITSNDGQTRIQKIRSMDCAVNTTTETNAIDEKKPDSGLPTTATHESCTGCHVELVKSSIFLSQGKKGYQCPACGLLFCKNCTMHRLPLPEITGTADVIRVCDSCYDIESRRLIEKQAAAKRHREAYERTAKRREIMESLHWWYQDNESRARQGPFDSARMRSWFDAGYFTTSLPLWFDANEDGRNAFRRRPMTILELFPSADSSAADTNAVFILAHPLAMEEANWVESTDPASKMTYYYNLVTEESSWKLPSVCGKHAADEMEQNSAENGHTCKPIGDSDAIIQYVYELSDSWYYKDHSGMQQGPFHADEMRAWMDAGYFTSALYARVGNSGPFRLLQNLYSDLSLAFTCQPLTIKGLSSHPDSSSESDDIHGLDRGKTSRLSVSAATMPTQTRNRSISASAAGVSSKQLHARIRTQTLQPRTKSVVETHKIVRKGFLEKRGRINKNFKRRFFVLDEISLSYFSKEGGKMKGQMIMTGVRIEKYETRSSSTGAQEFCLDIISSNRKLMLRAATMEDQVRWALSIEKVCQSTQFIATVVPLPSAENPSVTTAVEIESRHRASSTLVSPSKSMLKQDFSAVKVSTAPKPSTPLTKYRQWSSSIGSRDDHLSSSPIRNQQSFESKQPSRISDKIVVKTTSSDKSKQETRALRMTLRHLDHGHSVVDEALIKSYGGSTKKSEEEHTLLLNIIGSDSHPDLVKLNIFSRLDNVALNEIVSSMFKIPTYPGMQIIQEGDAGELFYCIGYGTYDIFVSGGKSESESQSRSQDLRHNVLRQRARSRSRSRASSLARSFTESQSSKKSIGTFCTKLGVGACFGEGALLNASRPASVLCSTKAGGNKSSDEEYGTTGEYTGGWVWALQRGAYSSAVRKFEQRLKRERLAFLKSVPLFSGGTLVGKDFARLSDALEIREWAGGQTIAAKGSVKKKMFIVKSGLVVAVEAGDEQTWSAGETFGNRALLYEEKWDASIVARNDTTCLVLDRKEFNRLVGSLKEKILKTWSKERRRSLCDVNAEDMATIGQEEVNVPQSPDVEMKDSHAKSEQKENPLNFRTTLHASDRDRPTPVRAVAMSESATVILAELDVNDVADDSDDSDEDDEVDLEDDSDDDYEELDIEWEEGNLLKSDIAYVDLEPRALLGAGSFGEVKLVLHKPTQRHYALKCMRRLFIVDNGFESMVENEKSAMCELSGRSFFLVNLYNTYKDKINIYMLMELCTGGELYDHLSKQEGKCVPMGTAQFYTACILQGLDAMHSRNIIYRDLKPENVMLDEGGYCKIVDFGLAKKTRRTYTVCGTPEYMAPEVVLSRGHDAGVDHWALGCMMYEMIAGYTPFVGGDQMEIYEHILAHEKRDDLAFDANGFKYNGRARSLLKRLLHPKKTKRLGTLVDGADGIRKHPFFDESKRLHKFDWAALDKLQIDPPFTPEPADFNELTTFGELVQDEDDLDEVDRSGWVPTF